MLTISAVGVAIKMGATKADFDSCVAIRKSYVNLYPFPAHVDSPTDPTSSEELVTLR